MITDINDLDFSKKYTYADYLTWQFKERVELIKGYVFRMSTTSNMYHQKISGNLHGIIWSFLRKKKCRIFSAPFDVRLPLPSKKRKGNKVNTVVQPDLTVVCNEKKLDQQGYIGIPNLVIEVLSPGNAKRETKDKFNLYEHAKIPEYWLVDPEHEFIIKYVLNKKGNYISGAPYTEGMILESNALKGLKIEVDDIFG